VIEVRKLTREEFNDLVKHAQGKLEGVNFLLAKGVDPYKFYQEDNHGDALLIDGVPVYCGCVEKRGHFTFTILRDGARERYPITLFKRVKKWLGSFSEVKCEIPTSEVPEARAVDRWIRRLGFVEKDNVFVLTGRT
jgi:hypothetical protein